MTCFCWQGITQLDLSLIDSSSVGDATRASLKEARACVWRGRTWFSVRRAAADEGRCPPIFSALSRGCAEPGRIGVQQRALSARRSWVGESGLGVTSSVTGLYIYKTWMQRRGGFNEGAVAAEEIGTGTDLWLVVAATSAHAVMAAWPWPAKVYIYNS